MIYYHYCQVYLNSVDPKVDEAVKKIERDYSNLNSLKGIGKISSFTGGLYVAKLKNPYAEVILEERKIEVGTEDVTVYFIRDFQDGLQDYIEIRDGKWLGYNPLPEKEIEKFKLTFNTKNLSTNNNNRPEPNEDLVNWQDGYKLKVEYDVFETEDWVKFALNSSIEDGMKDNEVKLYRLVLLEIFKIGNNPNIELIETRGNESIFSAELNDLGIIYSKIKIENSDLFLLHNGANIKTQNTHWLKVKKLETIKKNTYSKRKDISSVAIKAYPQWALKEADLWTKIEKNNEMGNLSLLPEQTDFLKDFKFPKYINGQAGSGKSTMLYYLFANAYYYKYAGEIKGEIIFLTENEKLLDHTKRSVYDLLLCNPEFDLSAEDVAITNVEKHFYPFKKFLLGLLGEHNSNFDPEKYLNFSKFKYLYEKSNIATHIKNKYSAELVWFTISTYVYGNDLNYLITSENYEEKMPKEGKELITVEDLKGMEKEVLKPFYEKLLEEGFWDKIKLIKHLTENVEIANKYEVIFCDEAQDFSRVELNFILKLSVYTDYNLSRVKQFPIVFAGDALQTVNPTGFSSKALTSMIYRELTNDEIGFKLESSQLEFTPTYNYRSSQTIVNVANAIQFYRKEQFGIDIQSPQMSKRPLPFEHQHLNVFVDIETFSKDEKLKQKVEFKTIIVPVNSDEIEDYKEKHSCLEKFDNIISAVDAKGIDFSEVVVYGFGEFKKASALKGYEHSFFFNKLYVAITRAQAELVIIDSKESKDEFWKPIIDKYISSKWAKTIDVTLNKFEDIIIFDSNEIIQSSENVVENDALRQKNQGVLEKNIPLLKVASSHFIKIKNRKEYYLCAGEIEEIKENWSKAAEFYLKKEVGTEGAEKASNSLWNGKLWAELLSLNENLKTEKQSIRLIIAKIFNDKLLQKKEWKFLVDKKEVLKRVLDETSWREDAILEILEILNNSADEEINSLILDILEFCGNDKDEVLWETLGPIYFKLKRYDACVTVLEKINKESEIFLQSKVEISKRKNNVEEIIFWLGRCAIRGFGNIREICSEVIYFYNENKSRLQKTKNIYVDQFVYFAYLIVKPTSEELISLGVKAEKSFEKREIELANSYGDFLNNSKIDRAIINFVLERWVKNKSKAGISIKEINEEYETICQKRGLKFVPFSEQEIINLPEVPTQVYQEFPNHIRNIIIKNFRKFKEVNIENIGLFNLVVGDNNIGKTSLLEALLFIPDKKKYIERLAFALIERTNIHPDKDVNSKDISLSYNLPENFIDDFKNCSSIEDEIEFNIFEERKIWNYILKFPGDLEIEKNSRELVFNSSDFGVTKQILYISGIKQPYMPYGKGFGSDLAQGYLEEIQNNPDSKTEDEFIARIKLFIPNIVRITANPKDGVITIRDSEFPDQLRPLHQYGEGANKLFRILMLLTIHKGKLLLIDEIDAGIHYSRFKEFWSIILKVAMKDKTQIICTTHNEECILYFTEVLTNLGKLYQNESRVIQMKIVKGIKVHSYEFDSFNLAKEDSVEMRGGQEI